MATQIQLRRDTAANWTANNPTLAAGEFAWESDTNRFKIGDGTTAWTSLAYASDGDTAGITFVGDDSTGTLVAQNETFKIAGTQNITTAVSGDTLTITGPDLTSYSTFSGSYTDLTNKPTIPTNNTELTNGAGYITASSTDTLTNKSGNISQFTNDSGYKTAVSEADVTQHQAALSITESQISDLSHFSGDYTDLTNKPTIPSAVSELTNDSGFISNSQTTIVGDDSTGTTINSGETFKIAGTQNVSTAVSGDTLTITGPDLSSYASTSYVDTAIANTVDSAPETLNTLNELAAALGDDANFATTTSTALGNRLRVDTAAQGLTSTQKSNATTNLGLATVATSGAYSDLTGTPTIPTNNNQLTNGAGYITGYSVTQGDVTAHQAALSITESQISDLGSYITASSTDTLTNKSGNISQWTNDSGYSTFSGSYNDLTNKPTIPSALTDLSITDGTSGQVLTTDGAGGFTFTTVSGGTITALNNQAENRLVTIGSTTTELDGEANLTFDGSTLTLTGTAALDGVTITDNTISTNASNADLEITANGTGSVALGAGTIDNTVLAYNVLQGSGASERGATRSYTKTIDWSTASSPADRIYGNTDLMAITVSGSGTGNSRERVRQISAIQIDTAGYNLPYQHGNYQANTNVQATELRNSSATASTVREITGNSQFVKVGDNGSAGNITVTDMTGNASNLSIVAPAGTTMSVTNAYGSISTMESYGGSGTVNLSNYYGYYVDGNSAGAPATNHYGFYVDDDSFNNRIGGVTLQNGAISTDGITINDNNISTTRSNDNLNITANGTGKVVIDGLNFPTTDGTSGQVLTTDGAGNLSFTTVSGGAASTGDFTFTGNKMTTSSSNADAEIEASGTGRIYIKARGGLPSADYQSKGGWSDGRATNANIMFYNDQAATAGSRRMYGNWLLSNYKLDGTDSSSSNARFRHQSEIYMDLNGTSLTNNGDSRGLQFQHQNIINNSSATTANLNTTTGFNSVSYVNNSTGSVNINSVYGGLFAGAEYSGTSDGTVTNDYGIVVRPSYKVGPSGALTITNGYGVYYRNQDWANQTYTNPPYFLYTDKDSVKSNPGALNKFNEWSYNATHSSGAGYTIDWANGNLQTVTLTSNITSFTMSNFPTATTQSVGVTLYLVQDGTGGRSMTFNAGSGETFKFANGSNSSSVSSANDIQVVYIFSRYNGSSNTYYWTIGPAYS